jgi:predicted amidohydrolase
MRDFTATAIQTSASADSARNLAEAERLVEGAAGRGARLVALPELFVWRGPVSDELAHAEAIPGRTSEFLSAVARRLSIWLVAGSILERGDGGTKCFNTCLMFAPDGVLLARYRKIHLFDVSIEGEVSACESRTRQPGSEPVCVDTELGRVGLAVCYDLRFPELFRRLADAGAEIVVMPSAFTAPTGRAHWHALIRARAIENQCYFIAPNQYGPTQHGFDNFGHSLIVDPWGSILAEGGENEQAAVSAKLSAARLDEVRRSLPSLRHRRLAS